MTEDRSNGRSISLKESTWKKIDKYTDSSKDKIVSKSIDELVNLALDCIENHKVKA